MVQVSNTALSTLFPPTSHSRLYTFVGESSSAPTAHEISQYSRLQYDHPTFRRHPQCTTDISMLQVQAATSRHTGLEKRDRSWSLMSGNTKLSHTAAKIIDRVYTLLFVDELVQDAMWPVGLGRLQYKPVNALGVDCSAIRHSGMLRNGFTPSPFV